MPRILLRIMNILCIETSTNICSAALCADGKPISERVSVAEANHAGLLPVYVESLLSCARESGHSIEAVAISEGPGSYTGLRIGASLAKGLCYGMNIPLIPVPTLQVLSAAALSRLEGKENLLLCPMLDARRMEVYTALYDTHLNLQGDVEARVVENNDWLAESGKEVFFFGNGAAKCESVLASETIHFLPDILPLASFMGCLAEQKKGLQGPESAYWSPFYLKEFMAAQSHVKGLK